MALVSNERNALARPRAFAWRWETQTILCTLVLGILAFVVLYPLVLLLISSFQLEVPGREPRFGLEGWGMALSEPAIGRAIWNTISLTIARQAIGFPIAILLAWLLARTNLPGKNWLEFLFWVGYFLPSLPVVLGWILLLDPQYGLLNKAVIWLFALDSSPFNIYTWWGIVWAHLMANTIEVKVMLLTTAFRNMDASLEESSWMAGASPFRTLVRIVVPVMTPAILVVLLISVIRSLEAFEIELILGSPQRIDVYSTLIYRLINQEEPQFAAATALSVLTLGLMLPLIVLQRWVVGKRHYTTITGRYRGQPLSLGRWRWPAFFLVATIAAFLTVVPVSFLAVGTFMRLFGFFELAQPWTLNQWRTILGDPLFLSSLWNTIGLGLGSAVFSVVFFSVVAYITARTSFWGRGAIDILSWVPWALPGIILGLGYLWLFLGTPFLRPLYGTMLILILVSVFSHMTLSVQIIRSSMLQLGFDLEEASWISGGTWWYTMRRVILPILVPSLVLVAVMNFIAAARSISSLALLVTSQTRPLALLQLDYMAGGRYEAASVVGLIVVMLTVGIAFVARALGLRLGLQS
ncbi:MAG: ABC transporter permease [Candidatus Binatia bacterium]